MKVFVVSSLKLTEENLVSEILKVYKDLNDAKKFVENQEDFINWNDNKVAVCNDGYYGISEQEIE